MGRSRDHDAFQLVKKKGTEPIYNEIRQWQINTRNIH